MTLPDSSTLQQDASWDALLAHLPVDLPATAFQYGALYRKRGVPDAATLLRLILAYACNLPLRAVVTWAKVCGLASLSDEALDQRIRHAHAWIAHLLTQTVLAQVQGTRPLPLRVRLHDTTLILRPGKTQPDWRGHLTIDLQHGQLDAVSLTDYHTGDRLRKAAPAPNDLLIADRGFSTRANVASVVQQHGLVLIRVAPATFPLAHPEGQPCDVLADACVPVAHGETRGWDVHTVPTPAYPAMPGRLIVTHLPVEHEAVAQERLRKSRKHVGKQKGQLSDRAVALAGYLVLWTNLPTALVSDAEVAALYAFRWQIELVIKRYKTLLQLEEVTARHDDLCRTVLLAKLLLAVLCESRCAHVAAFSPSA